MVVYIYFFEVLPMDAPKIMYILLKIGLIVHLETLLTKTNTVKLFYFYLVL